MAVTISFGPRLIEKRVENCIGQQRGNVLGQPAKYSLGLIKHDQPQAADNAMNRQTDDAQAAQCCPVLPRKWSSQRNRRWSPRPSSSSSRNRCGSRVQCWNRVTQTNRNMQLVAWEFDRISTVGSPAVRNETELASGVCETETELNGNVKQ